MHGTGGTFANMLLTIRDFESVGFLLWAYHRPNPADRIRHFHSTGDSPLTRSERSECGRRDLPEADPRTSAEVGAKRTGRRASSQDEDRGRICTQMREAPSVACTVASASAVLLRTSAGGLVKGDITGSGWGSAFNGTCAGNFAAANLASNCAGVKPSSSPRLEETIESLTLACQQATAERGLMTHGPLASLQTARRATAPDHPHPSVADLDSPLQASPSSQGHRASRRPGNASAQVPPSSASILLCPSRPATEPRPRLPSARAGPTRCPGNDNAKIYKATSATSLQEAWTLA